LNATKPRADSQLRLRGAAILLAAGQPARAVETVDAVLAAEDGKPNAMGLGMAADILLQTGQLARAEQVMARGVSEHPESGFLHFHYARTLAMGNKYDQALQELVAASKAEPGNPQYLMARAELLNVMGRGAEAQKVLQEAQAAAAAHGAGR
jgi:predicted Zn-dependent protease